MSRNIETRILTERAIASAVISRPELAYQVNVSLNDIIDDSSRAVIASTQENGEYQPAYVMQWIKDNNLSLRMSQISQDIYIDTIAPHSIERLVENLRNCIVESMKEEARAVMQQKLREGADTQTIQMELEEKYRVADMYFSDKAGSLEDAMRIIVTDARNRTKKQLFKTNWNSFDTIHGGGLLGNELVVMAARPSCGKTAAALQICCDSNERVVFFSLEMNKPQVANRLLSHIGQINTKNVIRTPEKVTDFELERINQIEPLLASVCDRIAVYDDPNQTISSIRKTARREVLNNGAKLVVIDYLQLITPENGKKSAGNREREVAEISRGLKNMSKELNVPVIVLAQLNRSCETENRDPRLGDLRESGAIEQDANSVLFLVPDDTVPDEFIDKENRKWVKMMLLKGRDVGQSFTAAYFNFNTQTFEEIDPEVIKRRNAGK